MVTSISEVLTLSQLSSQRQKGQMKPPRALPWTRSRTCSETRSAAVDLEVVPTHLAQTSPLPPSCGPPQRMQALRAGFRDFAFRFFGAIVAEILPDDAFQRRKN